MADKPKRPRRQSLFQRIQDDLSLDFSGFSSADSSRFSGYQQRVGYTYTPSQSLLEQLSRAELQREFGDMIPETLGEKLAEKVRSYESTLDMYISVSFYDLTGRVPSFSISGDRMGWSASTIKVPVMIAVFHAIDQGTLDLTDKLVVDHRYSLESYDAVTNIKLGTAVSVYDLLDLMISASDNEATNMLAHHVTLPYINALMQELGATRTMMGHLLSANVPRTRTEWNPDGSNPTTANNLTLLMARIYELTAASPASCLQMQRILEQNSSSPLGTYLPIGTIIGSKMGSITDSRDGDDLLVTGVIDQRYALTIMCNRIGQHKRNSVLTEVHTAVPVEPSPIDIAYLQLQGVLDEFHRQHSLPFVFNVEVHPQPLLPAVSSAGSVMNVISRIVYDVYYHGMMRGFDR
ncbi:MAG: serine hydrolase [Candidatus Woesearchaeota archaeon]|nr:serine hydrolase [Candidatus Woesearchaeota archaeon]